MQLVEKQTLSLDDLEPDHQYKQCQITVSNASIHVTDVIFDHCLFEQTNFDRGDFSYVKFIGEDLTNATFRGSYFSGCEFTDSRMLGGDFSGKTRIKNCRFASCDLRYSNFSETVVEKSRFIDSNLSESSFQAVQIKRGITFAKCQVNLIDFLDTNLKGVDLSTAEFESLNLSPDRIAGLIINSWQAAQFIQMFGVKIVQ